MLGAAMSAPEEISSDWRLRAEIQAEERHGILQRLVAGVRDPDLSSDLSKLAPSDVVITHDGNLLFAYASAEQTIHAVRASLEALLSEHGASAEVTVSHWDHELDDWTQVYPEPTAEQRAAGDAARLAGDAIETRTLVAVSGRLVREEFEGTMLRAASELGLECSIIENAHLLQTQVAFTVTGPRRKIDEFAKALDAEGWAMVRAESTVMISPL
jgi:hypothetical protein